MLMLTMTLAFFPLALVTVPIQDLQLFSVNLAFVALLGGIIRSPNLFRVRKVQFSAWGNSGFDWCLHCLFSCHGFRCSKFDISCINEIVTYTDVGMG